MKTQHQVKWRVKLDDWRLAHCDWRIGLPISAFSKTAKIDKLAGLKTARPV
jgi:hypothetical protein